MYKHNLIFIFLFLTSFWFHKSHSKNSLIKSIKIGKVSSVNSWRKTCYTCKGKSFIMFFKTIEYNESANKTVLVPRLGTQAYLRLNVNQEKAECWSPFQTSPPPGCKSQVITVYCCGRGKRTLSEAQAHRESLLLGEKQEHWEKIQQPNLYAKCKIILKEFETCGPLKAPLQQQNYTRLNSWVGKSQLPHNKGLRARL